LKDNLICSDITKQDHIGILNVNQRIKLIYGEEFGIEINSVVNAGTTIILTIPAKTVEELKKYVQGNAG